MKDIAILFLGAGVIVNSIAIMKLSVEFKKIERNRSDWFSKWAEEKLKTEEMATLVNSLYESFRNTKAMFLKLRKELIKNQILSKEFEYVDNNEAIEEVMDEFLNS